MKLLRYSLCQRSQKHFFCLETNYQADKRLSGTLLLLISGIASIGAPIKKLPGLSASRSFGSCDIGVNDLEFKIASTEMANVLRCSKVNKEFDMTRLNDF